MDYSEDLEYARQRLVGTIVRHAGFAVRIIKIYSKEEVSIVRLATGVASMVPLNKLNIKSPPLGYVNTDHGPQYLVRKPKRDDWRQGLRNNNLAIINGRVPIDYLPDRGIARTIRGFYPSFKECMDTMQLHDKHNGLAFHRHWAITPNYLQYKGKTVGEVWEGEFRLVGACKHLQESLDEAMA
jgi:hypothetical protein